LRRAVLAVQDLNHGRISEKRTTYEMSISESKVSEKLVVVVGTQELLSLYSTTRLRQQSPSGLKHSGGGGAYRWHSDKHES
jgi:hypothetical protein